VQGPNANSKPLTGADENDRDLASGNGQPPPTANGQAPAGPASDSTTEVATAPAADAPAADPPAAAPPAGGGHGSSMSPGTRRLVTVGSVLLLIVAIVGGGWYWHYTSQFVTTDNAQVDGDKTDINAPAEGTVVNWNIDHGSTVTENQVVGRIKVNANGPQKVIKSPGHGVVAVTDVVEGTYVKAGQLLATAYDYNQIYVTARVDEDDVGDVHVGAPVDISVDAYPDANITGVVENIDNSSAALVQGQSQNNQNGNFQKVTQVIPVKIKFINTDNARVVPGMNVTVHIHKKVNS
jgi:multidrug resistance efflux pump